MTSLANSNKYRIRKHFDAKADCYESSAILQNEVCNRMIERLDWVTLKPQVILDAGSGTGWGVQGLMERYKSSKLIALDLSAQMLLQTRTKGRWLRKPGLVCADAEAIPLADESVDLIFSNLMLQWCQPEQAFAEFRRILKPNGLLMFSTFGPDTLKELRHSWAQVDAGRHVNEFTDMHDLGDILLTTGFAEPVMDMDLITLTYQDAKAVMTDLKAIGANTPMVDQSKGLMTPGKLKKVFEAYEKFRKSDVLPATYEVVYGHAWKMPQRIKKIDKENFSIPVDQIIKPHK
ncbi:MAG: malonyl-ACP O-methyltransferase BioC [Gammaproteobacteria bacterium]|nr:malonyl-ACP O-methyltransferase BioC [Gammaproteobacteria bacterium]